MNKALHELFRAGPPTPAAVDAFIEANEFPLVDDHHISFVFRGDADEVLLRCWIAGLNTAQPFERMKESDLWATTIELPPGSRIEYKFELVRGDQHELVLDPLNPLQAQDPFGANSVCRGAGYERPAWTLPDPEARTGAWLNASVPSQAFGENRDVQVYLPARFRRNRQYPLLVVHDGIDYLNFASLGTVLDNLIHNLEIPQMIVALTQSPDRLTEYAADERHADFVAEDLLGFMEKEYPVIQQPRARGLMGASFGGVATLHAAWRHPGRFGCLLLQSGSFAFSDLGHHQRPPVFDPVVEFMNTFRQDPGVPAEKIYMSCGIYESLIYENRSLVPLLQRQNLELRFEEARDAHNWENWRDRLQNGLSWLFPGPVWMVYE
jgi:enterochelin esterase family protein